MADDHQMENLSGNLSIDVLANIFRYLGGPMSIMRQRRVSKKWKEAVKKTIIPPIYFCVDGEQKYNAMNVMTTEMPNLQLIRLGALTGKRGGGHKYSDGEDPDEDWAARTTFLNWAIHDIEIISNFSKLRILEIDHAELNGRYPVLFNSFPLLQKLRIRHCSDLKWDLEMLAGLPMLKELICYSIDNLTGNINSLRLLKDTLEVVEIHDCENIEGNFMDLTDFPHLKKLDLMQTGDGWDIGEDEYSSRVGVKGDIRDIGPSDFSNLELLRLPKTVYGARGYEFERITDAVDVVRAIYRLKKQHPALKLEDWYVILSRDSSDSYESIPGCIRFIEAGSRLGYQWYSYDFDGCDYCEVNWLDPEPAVENSDYAKYIEGLERARQVRVKVYKGCYEPPTEEECDRLWKEYFRSGR